MSRTTIQIQGMTCQHCTDAVTAELERLDGVVGVTVDLVAGSTSTVIVDSRGDLDPADVAAAIDESGYELVR